MSHFTLLLVLGITFMCGSHAKLRELPPYIKQCSLSDGKLNECIRENMELMTAHLNESIPEFKLPTLCPASLPQVSLIMNNLNLTAKNLTIFNFCSYQVTACDVDVENNYWRIELFVPEVIVTSHYYMGGRILLLNLEGDGTSRSVVQNVTGIVTLKGKRYTKNGKTYIDFDDKIMKTQVESGHVQFNDIFKGNEELTANTNKILNENFSVFMNELAPFLNDVIAAFVFNTITTVYKTYSLEELFKP